MKDEQVKAYRQIKFDLGDYIRCRRHYEQKKRELELIETKLRAAGISIDYSKPAVKTSPAGNAAYADRITDAMFTRKELDKEQEDLASAKESVANMINNVTAQDQRDVLRYKFLHWDDKTRSGWSWHDIAKVMGYTQDTVRHKSYEAIKALAAKSTTHNQS